MAEVFLDPLHAESGEIGRISPDANRGTALQAMVRCGRRPRPEDDVRAGRDEKWQRCDHHRNHAACTVETVLAVARVTVGGVTGRPHLCGDCGRPRRGCGVVRHVRGRRDRGTVVRIADTTVGHRLTESEQAEQHRQRHEQSRQRTSEPDVGTHGPSHTTRARGLGSANVTPDPAARGSVLVQPPSRRYRREPDMDAQLPRRSWVEQIMGMPVSVLCRGRSARTEPVDAAVRAVFAELRSVDEMFSTYKADSVVSQVRSGAIDLADCAHEVRAVAERANRWRGLTGGLFDPCRPDGTWDPSGLVKGWAVERAATSLRAVSSLDWCLNAGGDVFLHCEADRSFRVGIADPDDATRILTSVALTDGAVATSGTAARGRHIYDPRLGGTAQNRWASVTVTGPSLETADVLATAAFAAATGWRELLARFPDYAGLAIDPSGELEKGPGWAG